MRTKENYRDIWEKAKGMKIPHGFHIHHIDFNSHNNNIDNLTCVSPWVHYMAHKENGDIKEAAMLYARFIGGNEYPTYMYILDNADSSALWRMSKNGLIKTPRRLKDKGFKDIEVVLMDMEWVRDNNEIYSEPDIKLVNKILSKLKPNDKLLLEHSFGINKNKMTEKEMSKLFNSSVGSIRQKKHRLIKKLKNEME